MGRCWRTKRKGRRAHLLSVCLTVCPRPRSRPACLSVGSRSRRTRVFRPSRHNLDSANTDRSQPPGSRPRKKPRAIIMTIASASASSLSLSLSSPARCHHETPLLVSPYIHGVVLYSPSLWRWLPSSSSILQGVCGLSLASTTRRHHHHRHRQQEQQKEQQQQQQPSASTGLRPPYTTVRELALLPTGKGWRRLWLVTT